MSAKSGWAERRKGVSGAAGGESLVCLGALFTLHSALFTLHAAHCAPAARLAAHTRGPNVAARVALGGRQPLRLN